MRGGEELRVTKEPLSQGAGKGKGKVNPFCDLKGLEGRTQGSAPKDGW